MSQRHGSVSYGSVYTVTMLRRIRGMIMHDGAGRGVGRGVGNTLWQGKSVQWEVTASDVQCIPVSVLMETTELNENQAAKVNQGGVWELFQGVGSGKVEAEEIKGAEDPEGYAYTFNATAIISSLQ
ncbi:hypothetical protein KY290_026352 [Solanum tuberosum]|uniref:Uncharacterized protein n=1 Tax=Solanum tuberosum TaxID=4113 RepID=A0ABQ7UY87_SOLTU|nr:hypothetical protein KY289_025406 [Solanum tuberosum]KAH0674261.1 hypothetical protein KY284_025348 [Solanum tuberosum]KAH0677373.1 hypothetical protein KY285_025174 [Solanum tuberosum]KAH0756082.1 hypothetical protein KY290_026352 [Solanum tuberosum]